MDEMRLYWRKVMTVLLLLCMGTVFSVATVFSGQVGEVGNVELYSDALQLDLGGSVKNATIKISGPDDFFYQEDLIDGAYIPLDWMRAADDGYYNYEITGASNLKKKNRQMNNGRAYEPDSVNIGLYQSGGFRIENGMILNSDAAEEE